MKRTIGILILFMLPSTMIAQTELKIKKTHGGIFSLGMRTTVSTFNHGNWDDVGTGVGGQYRVQFHDRVNTEWYADYLTSKIGKLGQRTDAHIGWSVMFYPLKDPSYKRFLKPYIVMGHCFDYSKVSENANPQNSMERWSAAIQCGVGNHFNLTDRLDLTMKAQYMFHLGNHVEAHIEEGKFEIHEHGGLSLEGHLLFTLSVNYKIADLW
jgi:hypothetical protein